jgi:hypothetical protein
MQVTIFRLESVIQWANSINQTFKWTSINFLLKFPKICWGYEMKCDDVVDEMIASGLATQKQPTEMNYSIQFDRK